VVEAVGDSEHILAAVAHAARKFACDDIHFLCLPRQTPLARRLLNGNCQERISHTNCGAAMARIIHLPRALSKMTEELARRIASAGLQTYQGDLALHDGADWATLQLNRGKITVKEGRQPAPHTLRAGPVLAQFVLGTDDPGHLIATYNLKPTGDAAMLAATLFPLQHPMLPREDRY
jgi:hypothetical protein